MKFEKKVTCVVQESVDAKTCAIVVSHTMFAIGAQRSDFLGQRLMDIDEVHHGQLCRFPISILQASTEMLVRIAYSRCSAELSRVVFCESALSIWTDEDLAEHIAARDNSQLPVLGVGLAGATKPMQQLTGGLKLFRF